MEYKVLATVFLVIHFAYIVYVVIGGYIAWRWPRTIWLHLPAAAWGAIIILGLVECPLTYAENWARHKAGEAGLSKGFVDTYIEGVIYPASYTRLVQVLAVLAVAVSWIGFLILQRRRRRTRPHREVTAAKP